MLDHDTTERKIEEEESSKDSTEDLEKNNKERTQGNELSRVLSASEGNKSIREKGLSWQSTASLLLTEYVVLAILAFPSSYAVLGMAGGIICTLLIGLTTLWTSHLLWRFCLAHPNVLNIADAAQVMCRGSKIAWYSAFIGLAFNSYAIMGLHCVAGATAVQTIREGTESTLVWSIAIGLIMLFLSSMRELKHLSALGILASSTMFLCYMIVMIGHDNQGTPNGYTEALGLPTITTFAPPGTSFVAILNAILNITYTCTGQVLIPSFVGDMAHPEDFPKALYVSMAAEFILFTSCGVLVYYYAGTQYSVAPAYGSLVSKYGKVAAGFTLPTIIIVGILYSMITSRAIYFQIFSPDSIHRRSHTTKGWAIWLSIVLVGWIISFLIGEAVPFFNNLLALISAVFNSWFGFILWGVAWYQLNKGKRLTGTRNKIENVASVAVISTGFFFFFAGTYSSIQSILDSYASGAVKKPFQSTNTGFIFDQ